MGGQHQNHNLPRGQRGRSANSHPSSDDSDESSGNDIVAASATERFFKDLEKLDIAVTGEEMNRGGAGGRRRGARGMTGRRRPTRTRMMLFG